MLGVPRNPADHLSLFTLLCFSALQAGKFNIIPTIINIGSGVALMGAVSTPTPNLYPLRLAGEGKTAPGVLFMCFRKNRSGRGPWHMGKEGFLGLTPASSTRWQQRPDFLFPEPERHLAGEASRAGSGAGIL